MYICNTIEEVIYHYNDSGLLTMVLQEFWVSRSYKAGDGNSPFTRNCSRENAKISRLK